MQLYEKSEALEKQQEQHQVKLDQMQEAHGVERRELIEKNETFGEKIATLERSKITLEN